MVHPPDASSWFQSHARESGMLSFRRPFSLTMRPVWLHHANSASLPVVTPVASSEPSRNHCKDVEYSMGSPVSLRAGEKEVCTGELSVPSLKGGGTAIIIWPAPRLKLYFQSCLCLKDCK